MQHIGWFWQSVIAGFALMFGWVGPRFFERNFHVTPLAYATLCSLGVVVTCFFCAGLSLNPSFPRPRIAAIIVFLGMVLGGVAMVMLYQAVTTAPSPGLPVAVTNIACIGMLFISPFAYRMLPQFFDKAHITATNFGGVGLIIAGTFLIALRR